MIAHEVEQGNSFVGDASQSKVMAVAVIQRVHIGFKDDVLRSRQPDIGARFVRSNRVEVSNGAG